MFVMRLHPPALRVTNYLFTAAGSRGSRSDRGLVIGIVTEGALFRTLTLLKLKLNHWRTSCRFVDGAVDTVRIYPDRAYVRFKSGPPRPCVR